MAVKPDVVLSGLFHTPLLAPDVTDICAELNAIAVGVTAPGDQVVAVNGGACKLLPAPATLCAQLSILTPAAVPATPGVTPLVSADCLTYVLPTLCEQLAALATVAADVSDEFLVQQAGGGCVRVQPIDIMCQAWQALSATAIVPTATSLIYGNTGAGDPCAVFTLPALACAMINAIPGGGGVAAGDQIVALSIGGACKLIPFSPVTTNALGWNQVAGITSTVNGVAANISTPLGTIAFNLGYDAAGNPVYQAPAAFALCPALAATVDAIAPAVAGITRLVSKDCSAYVLPTLCTQISSLATGTGAGIMNITNCRISNFSSNAALTNSAAVGYQNSAGTYHYANCVIEATGIGGTAIRRQAAGNVPGCSFTNCSISASGTGGFAFNIHAGVAETAAGTKVSNCTIEGTIANFTFPAQVLVGSNVDV